jgi:hypothetical protein
LTLADLFGDSKPSPSTSWSSISKRLPNGRKKARAWKLIIQLDIGVTSHAPPITAHREERQPTTSPTEGRLLKLLYLPALHVQGDLSCWLAFIAAAITVLALLAIVPLIIRKARKGDQTIEDSEAAVRHFLPF